MHRHPLDKPAQYNSALRALEYGVLTMYVTANNLEPVGNVMRNDRGWHIYLPAIDCYTKVTGKFDGYLKILNFYKEQNGLW